MGLQYGGGYLESSDVSDETLSKSLSVSDPRHIPILDAISSFSTRVLQEEEVRDGGGLGA